MVYSYLNIYNELLDQLLLFPDLATQAANKDTHFVVNFIKWLLDTEEVMRKYNIYKCSELAGLRSKIIYIDNTIEPKKGSKRNRQLLAASAALYEAQSTVLNVLDPIEHRIKEARSAVRQLLGVAYQANMLTLSTDFNQMIKTLWITFLTHDQLRGAIANILVLVNKPDALRLLAEEIDVSMVQSR
jgi:hypothetical protein